MKEKIKLTLVLLLLLPIISCTKQKSNSDHFKINGQIKGGSISQIILNYREGDKMVADTAKVIQGKFTFEGKLTEPVEANIDIMSDMLWIEPKEMNVIIDMSKKSITLQGSTTNDDQVSYLNSIDSIIQTIKPLTEKFQMVTDSLKNEKNKDKKELLNKQLVTLKEKIESMNNTNSFMVSFIKSHPNSYYSVFLLFPLSSNEKLPVDTIETIYNGLSATVQKSFYGSKIQHDIQLLKTNKVGSIAPDFTAQDSIHNTSITLSDLKGKVVIMDFWAPWCHPCRWGLKHLKSLYEECHNSGLEVIAVYTDRTEDTQAWLKAIKDDELPDWYQVKIAKDMTLGKEKTDDIRSKYYVQAIPRRILIDKNGKIAAIWVGVSEDIEKEVADKVKSLLH